MKSDGVPQKRSTEPQKRSTEPRELSAELRYLSAEDTRCDNELLGRLGKGVPNDEGYWNDVGVYDVTNTRAIIRYTSLSGNGGIIFEDLASIITLRGFGNDEDDEEVFLD